MASSKQVSQWTVFEQEFKSSRQYQHPLHDVSLTVQFRSPSGKAKVVEGFWDGGTVWRFRFSPDEIGEWKYQVQISAPEDTGLNSEERSFHCVPYIGNNPLYMHGAVSVSSDKRHLQQSDGTPFFWLSDTVWNGPLKADEKSWNIYLTDRQLKGFHAIQFVTTQWIAADADDMGHRAYSTENGFSINPEFFQRMDARVHSINQYGMLAAPVLIWDANTGKVSPSVNPGTSLSDDDLETLAKYQIARYGAYQVAWILAGDGDYSRDRTDRWIKIGRSVFGSSPDRVVTLHPQGQQWIDSALLSESWFSLVSYQSGHGDSRDDFKWLTTGPPSEHWRDLPTHPIINLEPNYEGHLSYQGRKPFDARAIRRAAYWSLLVTPTAGVAYGAHGVWSWEKSPAVPLHHELTGIAPIWSDALKFPGSIDMKHLNSLFSSLKWWTLYPTSELVVDQPGAGDPSRFVAAAQSQTEGWALLYLPVGCKLHVIRDRVPKSAVVRWYDPSAGSWQSEMLPLKSSGEIEAPDDRDWIAWIGSPSGHMR